jgi:hypothetical protein
MTKLSDGFYDRVPRQGDFGHMTDAAQYQPLPDDWFVGVSDLRGSTDHVEAGLYKTVNMVGAAVVSAVMNAQEGRAFPFVFGGDGASFAVGPGQAETAREALAAVARWAETEFGMDMRVALVAVSEVRAAGHDVRVARFLASPDADYAMFNGGGLTWAETEMKGGRLVLAKAPPGTVPDLTGLSCRWAHMPARQGAILSLVVVPCTDAAPDDVAEVYREVIDVAATLDRAGHPAPARGMEARWPPKGATMEAHAAKGGGSLSAARRKALFEAFVAWCLIRTGWCVAGFDARRYARVVAANADFRKIDDGLKMTLDCDSVTQARLHKVLSAARDAGIIRFGMATQAEAMMTCIVPSIMTDDHFHFIDGAAGGYTLAASRMKSS